MRPFVFKSLNLVNVQAGVLPVGTVGTLPQYAGPGTPRNLRWYYKITGTVPATLTVNLEGNDISDTAADADWELLDQGTTAAGEPGRNVVNKNPLFVRAKVSAATGGDATTKIEVGIRDN